MVIINNRDKSCQIIDMAFPEDGQVSENEYKKVEKYQDLAREIRTMHGM